MNEEPSKKQATIFASIRCNASLERVAGGTDIAFGMAIFMSLAAATTACFDARVNRI
jgi:hypothetical protein